ncbi:ABC transporter substrate-binding protein [Luteimicrobium subarcticum]|uniref:Carbohydrate ABC transporter substrate-binding protein (CUT1 family) n=1 Tax=Luteimicrobium subarcticum TaxID=620910 RepID=A0A2M8WJS7_9MICO|nr:extracellular solute-binding protein [Luteimicrobium subarcticum]PJI91153.1 carbohydrate ABC transporter substrate-binding protein (CUT1 family) [Luteimicrobium subarcticum]
MFQRGRRTARLTAGLSIVAAGALALSACSGSDSSSGSDAKSGPFKYLSFSENTTIQDTLKTLASGQCADANSKAELQVTTQPQASFDQQIQLLAGQGALPSIFPAGNSPSVAKELDRSSSLVDTGAELEALGDSDDILPAAKSTIEKLYDGKDYVLPTELNVEGIWYNKKLFADNGIEAPATWGDLTADAAKLEAAGVQPFAADGKDGWPLTRLIGNYIYRSVGADALQAVADGKAKLTDQAYVDAAQAVADLGAKGYFGKSVGSIDYTTAMNQFLTGKAGMYYMGSWALANFNDPKQNQIGADNIGFVPFPTVSGGKGGSELAANVGVPLALSKKSYDSGSKAWLDCIAKNYGAAALKGSGTITGFKVNGDAGKVPALTKSVQEQIDSSTDTVLWFEALFDPKATTTSQTNAALLVNGKLSAADFMSKIQADLG